MADFRAVQGTAQKISNFKFQGTRKTKIEFLTSVPPPPEYDSPLLPSSRPISHLCIPTFGPPTNTSFDQIPHLPSCQALHSPLPAALARVRQLYPALSPATGPQSRGQQSQSIRRLSTMTRRAYRGPFRSLLVSLPLSLLPRL